jgi:hypothetical protein
MRIKLSVCRYRLPTVSLLWNVPQDQANAGTTITFLLAKIDEIIPLETDTWSLEDYTVEIGGFECLHFQPISSVIKEDDHVV